MSSRTSQFELTVVPESERRGAVSLALTWAGYVAVVVDLLVGGGLASLMPLRQALTAIVAGNLVLMLICSVSSFASFRTGKTFALLARDAFGERVVPSIALFLVAVILGWYSIQSSLFANFIASRFGMDSQLESILSMFLAAVMAVTAYAGIDALRRLSVVALPALALLCLAVWFTASPVQSGTDIPAVSSIAFSAAVATVIGTWIVGSSTTAGDIFRFSRSATAAVTGAIAGLLADLALMTMGAIAVHRFGTADLAVVLVSSVGFLAGLAFFALNVWTTNDNAMYSAGLNLSVATGRGHRACILAATVIAVAVSAFRPYRFELMMSWLGFLGRAVPPLAGVVLTQALLAGQPRARAQGAAFAVISLLLGVLVAFGINAGIPPINGLVAASLSYWVLLRVGNRPRGEAA